MLIIGAKGFAKEVLEVFHQKNQIDNLAFYDDINNDLPVKLYSRFPILRSLKEAENYFETIDNQYTIGIGNPILREKLYKKFNQIGGYLTSTLSLDAKIGNYEVTIGAGTNILNGAIISNSVTIGKGCIIYYNSIITHDCILGDFVEISPSVNVLGRSVIGSFCQIGSGTIILPDIKIGKNVIVGAGSVITKNVPDNVMVVGVPAKIVKELIPLVHK